MSKSYKYVERKEAASSALSNGYSELCCLAEEMREWADNMEGGNLGHTNKFEEVSAAADALENIQEEAWPEGLADAEVAYSEAVSTRKARGPSRAVRCSNAVSALSAVQCYLEDLPESEGRDELLEAVTDALGEAENAEFPGMY